MHVYSVFDPEFKPYGKVLEGPREPLEAMNQIAFARGGHGL